MSDITELRRHLFETLDALRDQEKPMDLERAKAISEIGQAIINTAKAEIDFIRVAGGKGTGFVPEIGGAPQLPRGTSSPRPGVLVHKCEG